MYCANCGTNIEKATRFCPGCGKSLNNQSPPRLDSKNQKRNLLLLSILLILLTGIVTSAAPYINHHFIIPKLAAPTPTPSVVSSKAQPSPNIPTPKFISTPIPKNTPMPTDRSTNRITQTPIPTPSVPYPPAKLPIIVPSLEPFKPTCSGIAVDSPLQAVLYGTLDLGQSISLTAFVDGYSDSSGSLTWTGDGTFSAPSSPETDWTASIAGNYTLTVTSKNSAGECSSSKTIQVQSPSN